VKHVVGRADEIPPGSRKIVTVDGRSIGVFNVGARLRLRRYEVTVEDAPAPGLLKGAYLVETYLVTVEDKYIVVDVPTAELLCLVADGFDVVVVGVAHEAAVVVGVVFGPLAGFVQHLGPKTDGSVEEGADGGAVGRLEGDVDFAILVAEAQRANPEVRSMRPVADDLAKVHDAFAAEWRQHGIVKPDCGHDIPALNGKMVEHGGDDTPFDGAVISISLSYVRPRRVSAIESLGSSLYPRVALKRRSAC
jgi:hypothetical protein